jgi:hypothetical protein
MLPQRDQIRYVEKRLQAPSCITFNVTLLRNIQTVQELHLCQHVAHISTQGKRQSHTFRISLFRTLQICWMSAALCETFSSEFPNNCSSSFWFFDASTSTPGCITTLRTIFSPMKFLYSFPSALHLSCPVPNSLFFLHYGLRI